MSDLFGGKNKVGREIIYQVNEKLKPPIEKCYSDLHPLLKKELFEDPTNQKSAKFFTIQDPIQLTSSNVPNQDIIIGKLFGMCSEDEIINKQQTSTANDFERLSGIVLKDDLEARIVNKYLAVKSFQRSDASRIFHKELVRSVVWCRMVVRRLLVYFIEADREKLDYLYNKSSGNGYKYIDIYNFLRDRLRAVWQDLTVQHANRHRGSIDCFEVSFRFLLISEEYLCNVKEFNSVQNGSLMSTCLDKLMSGYMDVVYTRKKLNVSDEFIDILVYESPYQVEFWSYRILTSMSIKIKDVNDTRIIDIINSIDSKLISHPLIQFSLGIHCSFRLVNIVRYFRYFRKCYNLILMLKQNQNQVKDSYFMQLEQYTHSLILICILIKKYSNIIRLKYLNIMLSSNMNRRQFLPLDQFIEIFGFYIESIESLRLFTERFDIKIINKEDPKVHLFEKSKFELYSINQLKDLKTKFVVSFKDCINFSSSIESLSILNSLSWPSEVLMSLLNDIPRIDILDPIYGKIYMKNFNSNKNELCSDKIKTNKELDSFTSLNFNNREFINKFRNYDIPTNVIKNIQDIDINKLKYSNKRRISTVEGIDSQKTLLDSNQLDDLNSFYNSYKKRMLIENEEEKKFNFIRKEHSNNKNQDNYHFHKNTYDYNQKYETHQCDNTTDNNIKINKKSNNINIRVDNDHLKTIKDKGNNLYKCDYTTSYNIMHDSKNIRSNEIEDTNPVKSNTNLSEKNNEGKDIQFYSNSETNSNTGTLYPDDIIEENLIGLSNWKKNGHFSEFRYNISKSTKSFNPVKDNSDYLEANYYRNLLLSKINLPNNEYGINQWLSNSIENILDQISADIISKIFESLKFSFIFFYNQSVNISGISRSHINYLNAFYARVELILSNLTNKVLNNHHHFSEEFLFPWNSVVVESKSHKNIIIDIYENYSTYINNDIENQLNDQIPIHVEMLSVWLNYNDNCLRNRLFSNIDLSIIKEKKKENRENKEVNFEQLIHEYLTNNGDIIIWTLPFLVQLNDLEINNNIKKHQNNFETEFDYIKKSINSFTVNISMENGKEQIIKEFEYCCDILNIRKYRNIKLRVPILKTITLIFSFVIYIPNNLLILLTDFKLLKQEIENLEKKLDNLINNEYLKQNEELVITDGDLKCEIERNDFFLISYSGISCFVRFKCMGFVPMDNHDINQNSFSIYTPGLNSLINSKLCTKNFSNNIVISSNSAEILQVDSITFISTLFLKNCHSIKSDNKICLFGIFESSIKQGFVNCFDLFTKGNIDWILLSNHCYYSDIKEIIIWIYNLYVHFINFFENDKSLKNENLNIDFDCSDNIFEFSRMALKLYQEWILKILDSYENKNYLNISQVIWNIIFDHLKPINNLFLIDSVLEIVASSFLNLIFTEKNQEPSEKYHFKKESKNLLELIDQEIINYKAFNYVNRFVLNKMDENH